MTPAQLALAEALGTALLGGIREDAGGPIPTYRIVEQELAAKGYAVTLDAPASAIAHARQHVTFRDLGEPGASIDIDAYCPAYPRPLDSPILDAMLRRGDFRHATEALAEALGADLPKAT